MRFLVAITTLAAAVSAVAVPAPQASFDKCDFDQCFRDLRNTGLDCSIRVLSTLDIGKCAAGFSDLLSQKYGCKGCFDRPTACRASGQGCPAVGTSYPKCLDYCAENIYTGGSKSNCPVWCQNTCGC